MAKNSSKQPAASPAAGAAGHARRRIPRSVWILLGVALIVTASAAAYLIPVRSEPFAQWSFTDFFLHGSETNPEVRLPVFDGEPAAVHVSSDGGRIWVVGEKSVMHSSDRGDTWSVSELPFPDVPELERYFDEIKRSIESAPEAAPAIPAGPVPSGAPAGRSPTIPANGPAPALPPAPAGGKPGADQKSSLDPRSDDDGPPRFVSETSAGPIEAADVDAVACAPAAPAIGSQVPPENASSKTEAPTPPSQSTAPRLFESVDAKMGSTTDGRAVIAVSLAEKGSGAPLAVLLFHSDDGHEWHRVHGYSQSQKEPELYVFDDVSYMAFDSNAGFFRSSDRDKRWNRLDGLSYFVDGSAAVATPVRYAAVAMLTSTSGLMLGEKGNLWPVRLETPKSGAERWVADGVPAVAGCDGPYALVISAQRDAAWVVGYEHLELPQHSFDRVVSAQIVPRVEAPAPLPERLNWRNRSLYFNNANWGWCWPELHKTENGGKTWKPTPIEGAGNVSKLSFDHTGTEGWVSADNGLFQTLDGGTSWRRRSINKEESQRLKQNIRIPPIWVMLLGLAGLGLVTYGVVQPPIPDDTHPDAKHRPAAANQMVDDRPVENVAEDQLGFRDVAVGLAQFLRNPKTKPPLTVAITGRWGSGKTSIMKMTESELCRERYPTVWFNAWHHRQEASMLAALLTQVRRKVTLPWTTAEGFYFRFRLAWSRVNAASFPRFRVAVAGVLGAIGAGHAWIDPEPFVNAARAAGYYGQRGVYEVGQFVSDIRTTFGGNPPQPPPPASTPGGGGNGDTPKPPATSSDWLVTLLFGGGGLVFSGYLLTLGRMFKVLNLDPTKLLTQLLENPKQVDLTEQLGFRSQFAREFREALESLETALGERLVIFIDDLDRCRPDHVIDVLETVNYLVSSGPCIIVFGIAEQEVKHYVGLHFAEVAASMNHSPLKFAEHYLEKLINVEIAVPVADSGRLHAMAAGDAFRGSSADRPAETPAVVRRIYRAKPFVAFASTATLIYLAYWIGADWARPHEQASTEGGPPVAAVAPPANRPPPVNPSATSSQAPVPTAPGVNSTPYDPVKRGPPAAFDLPKTGSERPLWPYVGFGLAGLVSLFALRSDRLPRTRPVEDSNNFTKALRAWLPLIEARDPSPRTVKRFSNRVRLFALQTRQVSEWSPKESKVTANPLTWWKWWRSAWWKASGRKQFTLGDSTYDEAMLVAVAAMEDVRPHDVEWEIWSAWCETAAQEAGAAPSPPPKGIRKKSSPVAPPASSAPSQNLFHSAMVQAIRDHRAAGLSWPPTQACRDKVMQLSAVDHG
jgi:hypothetical protein